MTSKQRLVVIGNGMAGAKFVQELVARGGPQQFDIVVFGEEPYGNYNRILLSGVLAGSYGPKDILLNSIEWYAENGVKLHAGVRVESVNRTERIVSAVGGIQEPYDRIVFAAGSRPFVPPIAGLTITGGRFLSGVFVFRTLDDAVEIMNRAREARKAVVLGGGLLGLEAARGLLNRGLEVHVVELMPHLMAVQLDSPAGGVLRSTLEKMGIRFHLGTSITAATGEEKISGVEFSDGSRESCEMLIISAGIRPNVEIAKQSGLAVERGIVVGDDLASTSDSSIFAIGECMQHRGQTYGLVTPGSEQAKVLADRLSGAKPQAIYGGSSTSTTLKVMGVDLVVMGNKETADEKDQVLTLTDAARGIYKKVILRDGRIAGAILLGDCEAAPRLLRMFQKREILRDHPAGLLFAATSNSHGEIAAGLQTFREADTGIEDEHDPLKEVIAVIRPEKWFRTKLRVEGLGITAFAHHRVAGRGRQRGLHFLARRGAHSGTGFRFLPKRMVSWIVPESQVNALVQSIMESNRTGQIGDGKIFVLPLDGVMKIQTDGEAMETPQPAEDVLSNAALPIKDIAGAHRAPLQSRITNCRGGL
jgi:nitrite reductase (NADH) large subunit